MRTLHPFRLATAALLVVLWGASGCARRPPPLPAELGAVTAPDSFHVAFETSEGRFVIGAYRSWSPQAVDRFYELVRRGYFEDVRFFRVIEDFVAQFGLAADPQLTATWIDRRIPDEPVQVTNARGTVAFARSGPNTRSVQLFINLRDNAPLDRMGPAGPRGPIGFPPIGRVIEGMETVDRLYAGYGEGAPGGRGPSQDSIRAQGNTYLQRAYPELDYIQRAEVVREWSSRDR